MGTWITFSLQYMEEGPHEIDNYTKYYLRKFQEAEWACWVMKVFHSFIPLRGSGIWQLCSIAHVTKGTVGTWVWADFAYFVNRLPLGNFRDHEPCCKFSLEKTWTGDGNTQSSNINIFVFHCPCKQSNLLTHCSGKNMRNNYC